MLRLIIETSNLKFLIGLHAEDGFVYRSDAAQSSAEQGAASDLLSLLNSALETAGRQANDIGEIVVDTGPGGLTSTRSGIAFANGLAFALNVPIVGLNSLELMELQSSHHGGERVVVARRSNEGKFFMGFFETGTCTKIVLGDPLEELHNMGWTEQPMVWIGPHPKAWSETAPQPAMQFDGLLSPGLEAFEQFIAGAAFAERPRAETAAPMNEMIKLQGGQAA